jgi:AraC family transcriptional regulator
VTFAPPRLERIGPLIMAGRRKSHALGRERMAVYADMAAQWRSFAAEAAGRIAALPPTRGYGVGFRIEEGATALEYFCGFAVARRQDVPSGFDCLELPVLTMAVCEHPDHVSHLRGTVELIYATVLPMAGIEPVDEADTTVEFVQRYSDAFNPVTGFGGIEVLVPVKV